FAQHLTVVYAGTEHNLRVDLDACVEQSPDLRPNVGALLIDAEQIRAHFQISRVHGNVLRRQTLFDDAAYLVFADGSQRRVVAIQEGEPDVFVFNKQGRPRVGRVSVAETEDAFIRALARDDLLERKTKVFTFGALQFYFPIVAALFADFENELSFAGRLKAKVEIVTNDATVDLYYSV